MGSLDLSFEENLRLSQMAGSIKLYYEMREKILQEGEALSLWLEMIYDLVIGAGYSYSRIAHQLHISPSTIQKLATHFNRKPRHSVFHGILKLHYKVFQGQYATLRARSYWAEKQNLQTSVDIPQKEDSEFSS